MTDRRHFYLMLFAVLAMTLWVLLTNARMAGAAPLDAPRPTAVRQVRTATPTPSSRTSRRNEQRESRYDEFRAQECAVHPTWCQTPTSPAGRSSGPEIGPRRAAGVPTPRPTPRR